MKNIFYLTVLFLTLFLSCKKEVVPEDKPTFEFYEIIGCGNEYFYYSSNKKNYPGNLTNRVWIKFVHDTISAQKAYEVLSKYEFLHIDHIFSEKSRYNEAPYNINTNCNCDEYESILKTLNKNIDIQCATPIFSSGFILINEVLLEPYDIVDSTSIVSYCSKLGLDLTKKTKYDTYIFQISKSNSITGFEGFDISNTIYESGMVKYAHPNFIFPISPTIDV